MFNKKNGHTHHLPAPSTRNTALFCLGSLLLGLLLVIWPQITETIVMVAVGAIAIVVGISYVVRYAMMDIYQSIDSDTLVVGLVWVAAGILVIALRETLVALLPVLLGFFILYCGLNKIHLSLNLKRMNAAKWILELINAGFSVVFGTLTICRPFSDAYFFMRFIGVGLIIESLADGVSDFIYSRIRTRFFDMRAPHSDGPKQPIAAPNQSNAAEAKETDPAN